LGTTLIAASTAFALSAPAMAAPLSANSQLAKTAPISTETIQYYRHHHHGGGGAVAGGIIGLAAGAIIGGAIAAGEANAAAQQQQQEAVAYCSQRFRSYDPASGTYLAKDGGRRPCP
jgi:alanine dehydrogenase